MAFQLATKISVEDVLEYQLAKASFAFTQGGGDLLEIIAAPSANAGIAQRISSATNYPYGVLLNIEPRKDKIRPTTDNTTTTWGERAAIIPCAGTGLIFKCDVTPLFNDVPCNANTSTTTVVFADTSGAGANAYIGSSVYVPQVLTPFGNPAAEQLSARIVTGSTTAGNVTTLTVVPAFPLAPSNNNNAATGEVLSFVRLVPYAKGTNKVKLDATNPHLRVSVALADVGGGHVEIHGVDLASKTVSVRFPQLPAV
jgi:hypothetical protein